MCLHAGEKNSSTTHLYVVSTHYSLMYIACYDTKSSSLFTFHIIIWIGILVIIKCSLQACDHICVHTLGVTKHFHLDVHYVFYTMLVQCFELHRRHFTNFHYCYRTDRWRWFQYGLGYIHCICGVPGVQYKQQGCFFFLLNCVCYMHTITRVMLVTKWGLLMKCDVEENKRQKTKQTKKQQGWIQI